MKQRKGGDAANKRLKLNTLRPAAFCAGRPQGKDKNARRRENLRKGRLYGKACFCAGRTGRRAGLPFPCRSRQVARPHRQTVQVTLPPKKTAAAFYAADIGRVVPSLPHTQLSRNTAARPWGGRCQTGAAWLG